MPSKFTDLVTVVFSDGLLCTGRPFASTNNRAADDPVSDKAAAHVVIAAGSVAPPLIAALRRILSFVDPSAPVPQYILFDTVAVYPPAYSPETDK